MKLTIIGTGYVGLTTGTCLAELGHTVTCVDNDPSKLELLKEGKSPIYEPGLEELIIKNKASGRLSFTDDIATAVKVAEVIFICVNTPPKEDGQADLQYVEKVSRQIAQNITTDYKVIVDKSTVPVRTAEKVQETISKYGIKDAVFDVVSNPEFLREGSAVKDTLEPDRIVIGVDTDKARRVMLQVYQPIIEKTNAPVKITSVKSAELIKHGANTFLAMKISFANLIAQTCETVGANALEVLEAIGLDERIGSQFLKPGIGFGGSCFPKDIAAFKKTLEVLDIDSTLVSAVQDINDRAIKSFIKKIEKELWALDGKTLGVCGLAFKPDTDDVRNAPALIIIKELASLGAKIKAYDPQAMANAQKSLGNEKITYCQTPYETATGCDALIFCTEWKEFSALDLEKLKKLLATPLIFDGRNIFDPAVMYHHGFNYISIGR